MDYSKHIQKAEEAVRRRNYDFAVQLYQQILEIDADVGEARRGLRRAPEGPRGHQEGRQAPEDGQGAGPPAMAQATSRGEGLRVLSATAPLDVEANMLRISLESAGSLPSPSSSSSPRSIRTTRRAWSRRDGPHRGLGRSRHERPSRPTRATETPLRRARTSRPPRPSIRALRHVAGRADRRSGRGPDPRGAAQAASQSDRSRLEDASPNPRTTMIELAGVHEKLKDPEAALDVLEQALTAARTVSSSTRWAAGRPQASPEPASGAITTRRTIEGRLRDHEVSELRRRSSTPGTPASARAGPGLPLRGPRRGRRPAQKAVAAPGGPQARIAWPAASRPRAWDLAAWSTRRPRHSENDQRSQRSCIVSPRFRKRQATNGPGTSTPGSEADELRDVAREMEQLR